MNQNDQYITDVLKQLPGLTAKEICSMIPDVNAGTLLSRLQRLVKRGQLIVGHRVIDGRAIQSYDLTTPSQAKPKVLAITSNELAELRQWKADAIARYPDLAVPVLVLKARKIVASKYTNGDAAAILRGDWDSKPIMEVALEALES